MGSHTTYFSSSQIECVLSPFWIPHWDLNPGLSGRQTCALLSHKPFSRFFSHQFRPLDWAWSLEKKVVTQSTGHLKVVYLHQEDHSSLSGSKNHSTSFSESLRGKWTERFPKLESVQELVGLVCSFVSFLWFCFLTGFLECSPRWTWTHYVDRPRTHRDRPASVFVFASASWVPDLKLCCHVQSSGSRSRLCVPISSCFPGAIIALWL